MKKEQAEDEALEDKREAVVDALLAFERLTSRREARLSAVLRERVEVMERMKRRRATMKKGKRKKRKLPQILFLFAPSALGNLDVLLRAPCLPVHDRCLRGARSTADTCSYVSPGGSCGRISHSFSCLAVISSVFGLGVQDYWMFLGDVDSARIQRLLDLQWIHALRQSTWLLIACRAVRT